MLSSFMFIPLVMLVSFQNLPQNLTKKINLRIARVLFLHGKLTFFMILVCEAAIVNTDQDIKTPISDNDKPGILWWTGRLFPHFEEDEKIISCPKGQCLSTKLRNKKDDASTRGFIFYGTDLEIEDMPLPRKSYHQWALMHEESPMNNFLFSHNIAISLFNYTATFRRESDYPLTTQFIPSISYLTERKPIPLSVKNQLRKNGLSAVLYVQSHCGVASDRDRYVKELSQYISIDSYGTCLQNKELPTSLADSEMFENEEFYKFISKYKFHLAFENAICDDYMTEKLFRPLHVGSVPIYKGSHKVKDWIPSDPSVIVVDDFESPAELAKFIQYLDENDEEYSRYLKFKSSEGVTNKLLLEVLFHRPWGVNDPDKIDFIEGFECFVCDKVLEHLHFEKKKINNNTTEALLPKMGSKDHMGCPQPHVSLGTDSNLPATDEWKQYYWVDSFWYAYDLGRALDAMIRNGENSSSHIHTYAMKMRYRH
ncbi:alpha-(1,3)-fucosyltransferase 11-like [Limulus polyphemus]|uniref:Fucosyltransferase n=1 Tax=Limulus polyphemus TaxID=6850 RepID=A0ABM1SLJ6_LIMPO|nr:alpha-(1,3)-fucosyltransferase 11-like [Limulus polyphemus]